MRTLLKRGQAPYWPQKSDGITLGFVTTEQLHTDITLQTPELNCGFVPYWWYGKQTLAHLDVNDTGVTVCPDAALTHDEIGGRAIPLWFKAILGPGRYHVRAELKADVDCEQVLLFVSRRRLCWRGAVSAGQKITVDALCDISPILPAGPSGLTDTTPGPMKDTTLDLAVVGKGVRLCQVEVEATEATTLFLMGDSTVTDQKAEVPYAPGACYAGWGQMLPVRLGTEYCVSNHAHSGLTTETFRTEGHYEVLRQLVRTGDLVLIQFGHNDQKQPHLAARTGYTKNLAQYIQELRDQGAYPVLVTPLARNTWSAPEVYNDLLAGHAEAVMDLGTKLDVPVVDLHNAMMDVLCQKGLEPSKAWFHSGDYTHTNDFGAWMASGFVAHELEHYGLAHPSDPGLWLPSGPLAPLSPPADCEMAAPADAAPLVDYGLTPKAPWKIY